MNVIINLKLKTKRLLNKQFLLKTNMKKTVFKVIPYNLCDSF